MRKALLSVLIVILFSSCATIFNSGTQQIFINTDKNIKSISLDSSVKALGMDNSFYVKRSRNDLKLNVKLDSIEKTIILKSKNSFAFWINIYFNYGVGMLVDKNNPKRYTYPKQIYLEARDSAIFIHHLTPEQKGAINWHIAWPMVDFYHLKSFEGYSSTGGFLGLETGVDYFYRKNHFLSAYIGVANDFHMPYKSYKDSGSFESSGTTYISLRDNINIGHLSLGYGLNASQFSIRRTVYDSAFSATKTRRTISGGLSFMPSYRFGKQFHMGLLYQPTLIDFNRKPNLNYQQYIFIELIWKLPVNRVL